MGDAQPDTAVAEACTLAGGGLSLLSSLDIDNGDGHLLTSREWLAPMLQGRSMTALRMRWGEHQGRGQTRQEVAAVLGCERLPSTLDCRGKEMTLLDVMTLCGDPRAGSSFKHIILPGSPASTMDVFVCVSPLRSLILLQLTLSVTDLAIALAGWGPMPAAWDVPPSLEVLSRTLVGFDPPIRFLECTLEDKFSARCARLETIADLLV